VSSTDIPTPDPKSIGATYRGQAYITIRLIPEEVREEETDTNVPTYEEGCIHSIRGYAHG